MKKIYFILIIISLIPSYISAQISISKVVGKYHCTGRVEENIILYSNLSGVNDASVCLSLLSDYYFRWEISGDMVKIYYKHELGFEQSLILLWYENNGRTYLESINTNMVFVKLE